MPRDDATLLDLARAAQLVLDFKGEMTEGEFLADLKTQSAMLHQLLVMGECVKRLSAELREAHAEIPWRLVAGMRDKLIHDYNDVDLEQVWRVAEKDIPELLASLEDLLPTRFPAD